MTHLDLYAHPHKALRVLLLEAVSTVGRTDFGHDAELAEALVVVRRTLRLASLHTDQEDGEVHPFLHDLVPELAADLEAAHDRLEGLGREIETCLRRMQDAPTAVRASLGQRVHALLCTFAAQHLDHMALEESRANRVLRAHLDDAQLQAVQERMLLALGPAHLTEWVELALSSGTVLEGARLLATLGSLVPVGDLPGLTARARGRLGEARWEALRSAAEALETAPRAAGA